MKLSIQLLSTAAMVCLITAPVLAQNPGATLFQSKCVMCHGSDGKGATPTGQALGVVNLHDEAVKKLSDAQLAHVITNGKNNMPAFGAKLTPQQIENLVSYIRVLQKK
ncbi:MAG: c-type cytochrome [Acidobacteriaceae bacterium]